jgi:hypothetical protein
MWNTGTASAIFALDTPWEEETSLSPGIGAAVPIT